MLDLPSVSRTTRETYHNFRISTEPDCLVTDSSICGFGAGDAEDKSVVFEAFGPEFVEGVVGEFV